MKKLICIVLALVMVLALCACSINKTEVSILWAGEDDHAVVPNSLINAMDRAMYIESIDYTHYAAAGDQAKQTQQATECLEAGCSALMVELVDASAAQEIVDLAKAKDVPVIFFGTAVDAAVVSSYAKCAAVETNAQTLSSEFTAMVGNYVLSNTKLTEEGKEPADDDMDLDNDGKITYVTVGELPEAMGSVVKEDKDGNVEYTIECVQLTDTFESLTVKVEEEEGGLFGGVTEYRTLQTADGKTVELLLVADDQQAMDTLLALQAMDINTNKLSTCFVPVFTMGADADYKAYVMEGLPTDAAQRSEYLAQMVLVADMTGLGEKEWDKRAAGEENEVDSMIFNTMNQIDTGRLSGTVVEDYDAVAEAAAKLAAQLLKGEALAEQIIKVSYTVYN